jgi:PEP-CTERM motif
MRLTTLFLSLILSAGCLRADILYNNFLSTSPAYDTSSGLFIENPSNQIGLAFSFHTPAYNTYLTSISMAATFVTGNSTIAVGLAADNGGVPGTILEKQTLNFQAAPVDPNNLSLGYLSEIVTFIPSTTDLLNQSMTYWVIAEGDGSSELRWNYNTLGGGVNDVLSRLVVDNTRTPPVETWAPGFGTQGAFEVQGNVVPEPGTVVLVSSGLLFGLAAARRRRLNN